MAAVANLDRRHLRDIAQRLTDVRKMRQLHLSIVIPVASPFIFHYLPIYACRSTGSSSPSGPSLRPGASGAAGGTTSPTSNGSSATS
jgi:hypothetical protein